jgi:hypothetical protein
MLDAVHQRTGRSCPLELFIASRDKVDSGKIIIADFVANNQPFFLLIFWHHYDYIIIFGAPRVLLANGSYWLLKDIRSKQMDQIVSATKKINPRSLKLYSGNYE